MFPFGFAPDAGAATGAGAPEVERSSEGSSAASDAQAEARRCRLRGGNPCVVRVLSPPGRANDAESLAMLIEAHRAMGRAREAQPLMEQFVRRYPTHPRAGPYRDVLRAHGASGGGG